MKPSRTSPTVDCIVRCISQLSSARIGRGQKRYDDDDEVEQMWMFVRRRCAYQKCCAVCTAIELAVTSI